VVGLDENMGKKEDIVNEVQVKNKRLEHAELKRVHAVNLQLG
jgi:hypothetical protein